MHAFGDQGEIAQEHTIRTYLEALASRFWCSAAPNRHRALAKAHEAHEALARANCYRHVDATQPSRGGCAAANEASRNLCDAQSFPAPVCVAQLSGRPPQSDRTHHLMNPHLSHLAST